MTELIRVDRQALPVGASALIGRFLFAYRLPDGDRYVIRHYDPERKLSQELEFDATLGRALAPAERLQRMPAPNLVAYTADGVLARATYSIRAPEDELWIHVDVYASPGEQKLGEFERAVYSALGWELPAEVAKVIERNNFPSEYARWDEDEKTRYWAFTIQRARRACGDSGAEEDAAFSPELLQNMEALDPQVRSRLSRIVELVARLGQEDPAAMARSFERRVGVKLG